MKISIILFILFLFHTAATASGEWFVLGSRSNGMGLASSATADFWSVNNNQAGMAFYDQTSAGIYFENRYLLKEMGTQTAAFTLKTRYGMLGTTVTYQGDAKYNSVKAGLAYSRKFGNRFAAGIQLDYISTSMSDGYGKRGNLTFDAGIMLRITEQLTFGAHTFNPVHAKISDYKNERIPTTMNAGFGFTLSDKIYLVADAFKSSETPVELRAGAEYRFVQKAFVRVGITTNPSRYTFGFGIELKNLTFDLSSSVHQQLGYSPQVSIHYSF